MTWIRPLYSAVIFGAIFFIPWWLSASLVIFGIAMLDGYAEGLLLLVYHHALYVPDTSSAGGFSGLFVLVGALIYLARISIAPRVRLARFR